MLMQNYSVITVIFPEMITTKKSNVQNSGFEIIMDEDPTVQTYCTALFQKIMELPLSELHKFIQHQCSLMKSAVCWLNKFEKLIALNEDAFYSDKHKARFNKLLVHVNIKRLELENNPGNLSAQSIPKKLINAETEDRIFSFAEVRENIKKMDCDKQKILHLTTEIFEYQQAAVEAINPKLEKYDVLCQKEIDRIHTIGKLNEELNAKQPVAANDNKQMQKLKINCNLNIFVDVLYQMQHELKEKGKPYLEATTQEIAEFMANNFVDKENQPVSIATVRTILTPSKIAKRPKAGKKIALSKIIKPLSVIFFLLCQYATIIAGTIDLDSIM